MLAEPLRIALAVGAEFDRLGVGWVVGGSVASSMQGLPRATQDIDLVADLQPEHAAPLARALREDFYADVDAIGDAIRRRGSFNVIHLDSMTKVDVKKGKAEVCQTWPRAEYLFGGDFLNQEYAEKMIDSALGEVSSGL